MPAAPDFPPAPDRNPVKRALISVSDKTGLVEAARVLAEKTREAAEEITEIARRAPASSNDASDKNAASVSATVEDRTAAESVPPATMEEDQDLANGRVSEEGLPPIAPASPSSSSSPPSGLPRSMSDQSANPPSPPPQSGATWSPTPVAPPSLPTPPVPPVPPAP